MTQFQSPSQLRASRLRQYCNIENGIGLEFGPLAYPIVSKSEGTVYYLDHLSTERLREKYANDSSINKADIVSVDIVFNNDFSVLAANSPYDYVIASHVFEHLANPIRWLQDIVPYLNVNATIALAIPDKRHTFDLLRETTRPSELLANYLSKLEKPSVCQVLDHFMHVAHVDTKKTWNSEFKQGAIKRKYDFRKAMAIAERSCTDYVDCHCTVWTSESFSTIWDQLSAYGLFPRYRIQKIFEPAHMGNDFVVVLKIV